MRTLLLTITLGFSVLMSAAQELSPVDMLFSAQSPEEFQSALQAAEKQGDIAPQVLLEARFINHIDQHDYRALGELSKELAPLYDQFDGTLSQIFTLEDDWKAIIHFTQALAALELQQDGPFKRHMQDAFWLSPRQAPALAPHIERFKLDKAMAKLKIDLSTQLPQLEKPRVPRAIGTAKAPAQLIFFWSPWSQEWIENIDAWKAFCHDAKQAGITSTCILGELNPEILADAKSTLDEFQVRDHATWLTEMPNLELSRKLLIQNLPTAILIKADGSILYNGTPGTAELRSLIEQF